MDERYRERRSENDRAFEEYLESQYMGSDDDGYDDSYESGYGNNGYESGYYEGKHGSQSGGRNDRSGRGSGRQRRQHGSSRHRNRRGIGSLIKRIIAVILIFLLLITAYVYSSMKNFDRVDTDRNDFAMNTSAGLKLSKYRNILILGSDARKGEGYDGSRTDAIIIVSINKVNGDIRLISVMRDSYLKMAYSDGSLVLSKITHAHAYGGGMDTVAALNRCLDLNIKEYMVFNWKAVKDTVDNLGGIEVKVRKSEIRDMNRYGNETARNTGGKYHKIKKAGVYNLDGVQAATYCRIRKTSGGDTGRARRYKTVMRAVIKKSVTNPVKFAALKKNVFPEIRTNMSQLQMTTAIMRAPGYDIKGNIAWPKKYYGGIVNGLWYAVPQTLNYNVKWLHKKAFGQEDYQPSSVSRSVSDEIIRSTGIQ